MEYRCKAAGAAPLSSPNLEISCNDKHIIPVVPARGRAEVALGSYYKTFSIYKTCMRCAPARPVRACFVWTCCTVVVQEHGPHTTTLQCNAKRRLCAPKVTLETPHFTLHTSSHLISSHLISSHLTSSYLISSHLISSHICNLYNFFSTNFISADHCSTFLISWKLFWTHLRDSVRQKAFAVSTSHYYFVLQNLHNVLPSTTLYYKWVRLMDGGKSAEHNQDEQRWIQTSGGRGSLWCLYAGLFDKKR